MDPEYYLEREQTELRMAAQAIGEKVRAVHLELAGRYRALAETYAEAALPRPRTACG